MQPFPLRIDLFTLIMLLGVAQGAFLGVFFLTGRRGKTAANRLLGWLMLSMAALVAEIGLCYSNYIMQCLALIDFSEPVAFWVGPLVYLFVVARLRRSLPRHWHWHLLPGAIWAVNAITWLSQPTEFKYNSFIHAYHPELPYIPTRLNMPHDATHLRPYVTEIVQVSILLYTGLALFELLNAYRRNGYRLWQNAAGQLSTLRNMVLMNVVLVILIFSIKPAFDEDLGDYIFACYITVIIYAMSALVMRGSDFFTDGDGVVLAIPDPSPPEEPKKKYQKSVLSDETESALLTRLDRLTTHEQPHLQPDLSLPKLATRLGTSPHHLSQLLNDRLGMSFFDWLATHRIAEAQRLLHDPGTTYLKIDEIAERVGYNSPSAFHTAFKRISGQTPAQFRDGRPTSSPSA